MSDAEPAMDGSNEYAGKNVGDATALTRGEIQDRAVKGVMWTILHTLVALPLAFVVNLVVARVLLAENYGRLAFLTTFMDIASGVVAVGLAPAMTQFGAQAHARGDRAMVRQLLSASQGFRLLIAAPLLTVAVVLVADLPAHFLVAAVVFGIWFPAALSGAPLCLGLENKSADAARIAMVINLLVQAAVLAAVLVARTADAVWAARILVGGSLITLALIPISKDYRRAVLRPSLPHGFPKGFWRFGIPAGVAGLVATLALSRTEVLFLTALSPETAVGIFALAYGVSSHLFAPAQALVGPLVPAVSGIRGISADRIRATFERAARGTAVMTSLVIAVGLAPVAVLVPLLYGTEYAAAAPLVLVLGVSGGLVVASGVTSAFVSARRSAGRLLYGNLAALVVNVGAALALIPVLDAWGAAIANALGAATTFAVLLVDERRAMAMTVAESVRPWLTLVLAAVSSVGAYAIVGFVDVPTGWRAVLAGLGSSALFVALVRASRSGLTSDDVSAVTRVVPLRLRRSAAVALRGFVQSKRH